MKLFGLCLGVLISGMGWTASFLDQHCRATAIKSREAVIKIDKPSLIIVRNISDRTIWITHPVKNPGASAGWASEISPKRYSALYLSSEESNFTLACIESTPGHEQHISCAETLRICILSADMKPENASGAFWAVENIRKTELIPLLTQRGFEWSNN